MNTATIIALLQMTAAILAGAQGPQATTTTMQSALNVAQNTLQTISQSSAQIPFSVVKNDSSYPNAKDLNNAPYRDASGKWVRLGSSVELLQQYTSFGDLNADGIDDAAVIVKKTGTGGTVNYYLAAMLNQGGIMFDVADFLLGTTAPTITDHHIENGLIKLNAQQYKLFGIAIVRTQ